MILLSRRDSFADAARGFALPKSSITLGRSCDLGAHFTQAGRTPPAALGDLLDNEGMVDGHWWVRGRGVAGEMSLGAEEDGVKGQLVLTREGVKSVYDVWLDPDRSAHGRHSLRCANHNQTKNVMTVTFQPGVDGQQGIGMLCDGAYRVELGFSRERSADTAPKTAFQSPGLG